MFVDRVAELRLLEQRHTSGKAEFFVLYGRRRVGKTELLAHFCEGKRHIFFVADQTSEQVQRASLSAAVNKELFGVEGINAIYPSWEDLFQAIARAARDQRLILVLDEFPYLVAAYPPLASILQRLWDQTLKNSQLMLVLCGSYIGMMEELVLGYQAPLYGRRTSQYLLDPLGFYDSRMFFSGYEPQDQVRSYGIYGGTPAYLQTLLPNNSLEQNIREGILSKGAFLYDEVRFVLQQELREPRNYFAILQAVASGKTRLNEIKQATGLESANPYLDTLQQLRLIERVVPITESQPHKSRRGIYRIRDHYLRFWFRFVQSFHSRLELGDSETVLRSEVLPQLDAFTGLVFEDVCQQFFWRAGLAGQLPVRPYQIGGWWNHQEEIDAVVIGEKQVIVAECKWASRPVGTDIFEALERKAMLLRTEFEDREIFLALCARSGFTPHLQEAVAGRQDVLLFDLPAILK